MTDQDQQPTDSRPREASDPPGPASSQSDAADISSRLSEIDERAEAGELTGPERERERTQALAVDDPGARSNDVAQRIRARLAALDALYAAREITAAELGEARRLILSQTLTPPPPPVAGPGVPLAQAQEEPAPAHPGGGGAPPADGSPSAEPPTAGEPKRVLGLPIWGAAVVAGALVIGAIVATALLVGGGGDTTAKSADDANAYVAQIKLPLNQLTLSAVATGKALARVGDPGDVARLHKATERQIDLVEEARGRLAKIEVAPENRPAQVQLAKAAALQRRYLVALGRASVGTANDSTLSKINHARLAGALTLRAYRTFFTMVAEAPNAITGTDLTDTSGLRSAVKASIAQAQAEAEQAAAKAAAARRRAQDPSYSGAVFSSVGGVDNGGTLTLTGSYCDRTPGAVNTMVFTMELISPSGVVVDTESQQRDVTRACGTVTFDITDTYGVGSYTVQMRADNLTNNVSGSGQGSIYIS